MNLQKSKSLELMSKINRRNSNILYILFFVVVGGLLLILVSNEDDYTYDAYAQDENNVTIKTIKLTDSLYMLLYNEPQNTLKYIMTIVT